MTLYKKIQNSKRKLFAVLIDPDKVEEQNFAKIIEYGNQKMFDFIFVGGSIVNNSTDKLVKRIKSLLDVEVVLFPGNPSQISNSADAILFLSLLSGRNPEYLIGHHVSSAKALKNSNLEVISTGYILIQGSKVSSTEYITNTKPIPGENYEIAVSTAIAGELLGMKIIYLEGGSGAEISINEKMISEVKNNISIPLIVGGGIKTKYDFETVLKAGADLIVVGNAIEENPDLIKEFGQIIR
ncbi:MAG: geranylgeranylglyceryl/heptaprenylglyceryl phosphate synthase [Bacteroidales bacterium]|nr:geranylgeranylglyceryl/heptaprenylglyceryl phosphate synthase [Bacteroidales bacterium]